MRESRLRRNRWAPCGYLVYARGVKGFRYKLFNCPTLHRRWIRYETLIIRAFHVLLHWRWCRLSNVESHVPQNARKSVILNRESDRFLFRFRVRSMCVNVSREIIAFSLFAMLVVHLLKIQRFLPLTFKLPFHYFPCLLLTRIFLKSKNRFFIYIKNKEIKYFI